MTTRRSQGESQVTKESGGRKTSAETSSMAFLLERICNGWHQGVHLVDRGQQQPLQPYKVASGGNNQLSLEVRLLP